MLQQSVVILLQLLFRHSEPFWGLGNLDLQILQTELWFFYKLYGARDLNLLSSHEPYDQMYTNG